MKQVIIDSEAESELSDSVALFERIAREAVRAIQANPDLHPLQKDGTRRLVIKRFPFILYYVNLPSTIWVLAFAHTSREPGYWRRRL